MDTTGSVAFSATGVSESVASATASASGGNASNSDGSAPSGEDSNVDAKVGKQSGSAETKASDAGVGSGSQQSADKSASGSESGKGSTQEGSVAVAAAIAVDVADSSVQAYVPAAVGVRAGGSLSVQAVSNMDAGTQADGSQVAGGGTSVGIGAAVAITLAHQSNDATLGAGSALSSAPTTGSLTADHYQADSLSLGALQTDQGVASPAVPGSSTAGPAAVDQTLGGVSGREDLYSASATSGAGASKVGLAGSLAVNVIDSDSEATVQAGAQLNLGGGALDLGAADLMSADASATPSSGGASGGKLGVGASVALNTITEHSLAQIADGVDVSGTAASLEVAANSLTDTSSTAQAGASGGVAVDAVVAMSLLDETTQASVGSGSAIDTSGDASITAASSGANTASAIASIDGSSGSSVAVGGSVAVITGPGILGATSGGSAITSSTSASLARDAAIGGALQIEASSTRTYDAESTASASGNAFSSAMQGGNDSTSGGGSVASGDTLNTSQAQGAMSQGSSDAGQDQSKASGKSASQGKVSVAAAVGAVIAGDQVSASIVGGSAGAARTVSAASVQLTAVNHGDVFTEGDGATDTNSKVGIGVGVALSLVDDSTSAGAGDYTDLSSAGAVAVSATSTQNQDASFMAGRVAAVAMSGAAAGKVAVAGAIAVAVSTSSTSASLGQHDALQGPGTGASGAVTVLADNTSSLGANAWSGSASRQGVGIGASIAAVISTDSYAASVGQDSSIDAASLEVSATNEKVDDPLSGITQLAGDVSSGAAADSSSFGTNLKSDAAAVQTQLQALAHNGLELALLGQNNYLAEAGAGAASGNSAAIAGGFAVQVIDNQVSAGIGAGTTVHSAGAVKVQAQDQTASKTLVGSAAASGGAAGVGVDGAFILDQSSIQATLGTGVDIASSSSVQLQGGSTQDVELFQFSAGAADEAGVAGVIGLITSQRGVTAQVGAGSSITSSGALDVTATNDFSAVNLGGSVGVGGSAGVGATLIATTVDDGTTADIDSAAGAVTTVDAASVDVSANSSENVVNVAVAGSAAGDVAISGVATPLTETLDTESWIGADAGITSAGEVQVGAGDTSQVVNVGGAVGGAGSVGIGLTAAASTFVSTVSASIEAGATISAASLDVAAQGSVLADNIAVAGAVGGDVGASGVLTPVTQDETVSASIGAGAQVTTTDAATGFVDVTAGDTTQIFNLGGAVGGGAVGVGGSAAASVTDSTTQATIGDGAALNAAGAVDVAAQASENIDTSVVAGAAGGVGVAVALGSSDIVDTTEAWIGYGASVSATAVTVQASDDSTISDIAGSAAGGGTGVSAGADVDVLLKHTYAWIGEEAPGASGSAATVSASSGDVKVSAASSENLSSVVAGAAIGGDAGAAGAVQTYVLTGDTEAAIGAGDQVSAHGNVAVLAADADSLNAIIGGAAGGGAAGIGASIGVTVAEQTTLASIAGNASVTALGQGAAQSVTGGYAGSFANGDAEGDPTTAAGAQSEGNDLTAHARSVTALTRDVHGVVVDATATASLKAIAVSGAVGGAVGAAVSGSVPVVISDTEAGIGAGASIDQGAGTASGSQSVAVAAASDLYVQGIAGALGGGGAVGIGAGLMTNVINNTTKALVGQGATVAAQGNVDVTASASEDFSGLAASAGLGGTVGVAGGATVLAVDDTTLAEIDGSVDAGGSVVVAADDQTRAAITAGSVAVGATGAGVGAGIGVVVIQKDTEATLGAQARVNALGQGSDAAFALLGAADSTATTPGQGLLVSANAGESIDSIALAGAGGAFAGVAGAVSVQALSLKTLAGIDGGASVNTSNSGAAAAQAVDVVARDSSTLAASDGAAGIGAAGVGGAVNVAVLTSDTGASIGDGATVDALGDVSVAAYANKAASTQVYGVGGGLAGLGASIDVLAIADGASAQSSQGSDSETIGQLTTTSGGQTAGGNADSAAQNNTIGSDYLSQSSNADVRSASSSAQGAQGGVSASGVLGGHGASGTFASIGNASVHAGGKLSVQSDDHVDASATSGALGVGGVGIGAGVGVTVDSASNTASIAGSSTLTAGSIQVGADTTHTLSDDSKAGAVGLLAGADAVVAYGSDSSATQASVNGSTLQASGAIQVSAQSRRSVSSSGQGAALSGSVAAGASVAIADVGGSVGAGATGATLGSHGSPAGSVSLGATSTDSAEADSVALSAGLGIALDGSVATANVHPDVRGAVSGGSIDATGSVGIAGIADDSAQATASGGSVAIVGSAGASVASAGAAEQVSADLGGASVTAGSLAIDAEVGQGGTGPFGVGATASGISGALFVGANASSAVAANTASALATAENSSLDVGGSIDVEGLLNTAQDASASGVAAGLLALGADTAQASSDTSTQALFNDMGTVTAGSLSLNANGADSNTANATAGSGGAFAGAAAVAQTSSKAHTVAGIGNDTTHSAAVTVNGGAVDIHATHTAVFGGWVDSTNAALVGASGAELDNTVDSTVNASLGPDVQVQATDFSLDARNLVSNLFLGEGSSYDPSFNPDQGGWNLNSGSGGLINAPAGSSTTKITLTTGAAVGAGAEVHLIAPADPTQVSTLSIEAYNDPVVQQRAQMNSGGAVALAEVADDITVNDTASVSIGDHATLLADIGDVQIGAWGDANLYAIAVATTYGVAGAPTGQAHIDYTGTNLVSVGTDAEVQATDGIDPVDGSAPSHGTVRIAAGDGPTGTQSNIQLDSEVDLYNNTAIPIPTPPDAQSNLASNALVVIAADPDQVTNAPNPADDTHYGINAAGDITVSADQGAMSTTANGTGTNIYLEALSKVASAVSNLFGGGNISFTITGGSTSQTGSSAILADGLIDTGIQRDKTLSIDYATQSTTGCNVDTSACLAAPNPGDIGYTTTSIVPGGDILTRLSKLQQLQVEYAQDPIAVAAYQNEITFLETELVSLGMGYFDTGGAFHTNPDVSVPSQAAQQQLATDQTSFSNEIAAFVTATSGLSGDDQAYAAALSSDVNDSTYGLVTLANSALGTIKTFGNYAAYTSIPSGQSSSQGSRDVADVSTQESALQGYASAIQSDAGNNATRQADIATQISTLSAGATSSSTVSSAKSAIDTDLAAINANVGDENGKAGSLKSSANTLYNDLTDLAANSKTSSDSTAYGNLSAYTAPTSTSAATGGALGMLHNGPLADVATQAANITGVYNAETASYATLSAGSGTAGSVAQYVAQIQQDAANVATDQSNIGSSGSTATVQQINVDPAVARLGNIELNAQVLSSDESSLSGALQALVPAGLSLGAGQGQLRAPGNAQITITNNTADPLALGDLTIPDYSYGLIRFNGTEVNTAQDVTALNAGGVAAGFGTMITAADSAAPSITITSNYNPTDAAYYDPAAPSGSPYYLTHQMMAPDITLDSGSAISNANGAVTILSAAGNIYEDGTIHAQSVSITARNGDFASSYINGIDSIAGDPSSQNPALDGNCPNGVTGLCADQSGLGQGIVANGNISIAARFLNINGLIQSGIVDNTLDIASGDLLSTNQPGQIGASAYAGQISSYETQYNNQQIGATPILLNTDSHGNQLLVDPTDGTLLFSTGYANDYYAANPNAGQSFQYALRSPGSNIGATYDAVNRRYLVDSAEVHGGYIQLFGQLLNTSPTAGQLKVLDGFGTIDITNTTSLPVVLSTLDTGADPQGNGRGTAGVIDITDVHLNSAVDAADTSNAVDVTHTVYTYDSTANNGQGQVQQAQQSGTLNADGTIHYTNTSPTDSYTSGSTASYAPLAGERYVWQTAADNTVTTTFYTTSVDVFHSSSLAVDNTTNWQGVSSSYGTPVVLPNGTYISTLKTTTSSSSIVYNGTNGIQITDTPTPVEVSNTSLENTGSVQTQNDYMTSSSLQLTGSESHCNWWTLCIASNSTNYYKLTQDYTEIVTNSLKADYGIGVSFIGSRTGGINVQSAGNVVLTGAVSNASGTTTISAGTQSGNPVSSIEQGASSAVVRAKTIDLYASGSIGGVTDTVDSGAPAQGAVGIALAGGALNAVAGENSGAGDVSIAANGDLVIGTVSAGVQGGQSSVLLSSDRNIVGSGANSLVQGDYVALEAVNGSIGGVSGGALTVDSGFTADQNLRPFGDPAQESSPVTTPYLGLRARAAGNIDIAAGRWADDTPGNLLVDTVVSTGGSVTLSAPGQILDNDPVQTVDQRTYQQLLNFWDSLGLTAGSANTAKQQQTVAAYQRSLTQEYQQYWAIRDSQPDGGASYDPNFQVTFSAQQRAALSAQGLDSSQIDALAAAQTQQYHSLNAEVGGLTASYVAGYQYQASAAEQARLTQGATWTSSELSFAFSAAVLKTVTNTNDVVKAPNVSGRSVTLDAGTGIGETTQSGSGANNQYGTVIQAGIAPSALTDAQKVALASAEAPDLQLTIAWAGGTTTVPLGTPFEQLDAAQQAALDAAAAGQASIAGSYLTILSKRPLNVAATDSLNLTVSSAPGGNSPDQGNAYVASLGSLDLGSIDVPGQARIKVLGSLANASVSSIRTGDIILEGADGSIGAAADPLDLALLPGATLTARAENGVYLATPGQAAQVDTLYSPGTVWLSADGSILNATGTNSVQVLGNQVDLISTGGSIGTAAAPLQVGVTTAAGSIQADAAAPGQSVWLDGPAGYDFVIGGIDSGGSVNLQAAGDSILAGAVDALGQVSLSAGGEQVFDAAGSVLSTAGGVTLAADSLKMLDGSGIGATAGDILIATTGDALLTGLQSGSGDAAAVSVDAGGHVLAGTASGRTDIRADAAGAGVSIHAGLGIGDETEADSEAFDAAGEAPGTANRVSAVPNPLIISTGNITLSSTRGDIDVVTTAPVLSGQVSALDGSVDLLAQQDLSLAGIFAPLGSVSVRGDGAVTLGSVSSGGSQLLQAAGQLDLGSLITTGLPGDPGNIVLQSSGGGIQVGSVNGHAGLSASAQGSIEFGALSIQGPLSLSSDTALNLPVITIGSGSSFAAPTIDIAGIVPAVGTSVPFELDLGGPQGSVGLSASVSIDTTLPVVIGSLREGRANIVSNSPDFRILNGYILQQMLLSLPDQTLDLNSLSPRPAGPQVVSIFNPGLSFQLTQLGNLTITNAFLVNNTSSSQLDYLVGQGMIQNQNFVDDFVRGLRNGDTDPLAGGSGLGLGSWFSPLQAPPSFGSDFGVAWPSQPAVNLTAPGTGPSLERRHGALLLSSL
ncbi:MAG: hypothetical protein KGJ03_01390 [Betaproteobacteria bacterium]|nr:hypothetical protein [Betaproteobacteria bacterium]